MNKRGKSTVLTPDIEWTEQDWLDLYKAMEWVKRRVLRRHKKPVSTESQAVDSLDSAAL